MKPMGQLAGHSSIIRSICGVDNTIWSSGEDYSICIWDIDVCFLFFYFFFLFIFIYFLFFRGCKK